MWKHEKHSFITKSSLFSNSFSGCMDIEQLEISEGHVFILKCPTSYEDEVVIVNWTRELNQDWDAGIKIIDQSLWFFPVKESHSGNYSCYYRYGNTINRLGFSHLYSVYFYLDPPE